MPLFDQAALQRQAILSHLAPEGAGAGETSVRGIGIAPYAAAIGGQAADAASTLWNFHRGYGESNGTYGGGQPVGKVLATKAALGIGVPLLMRYEAQHGHPTVAKALGYLTGAAGAIPAAINLSAK